MTYGPGAGHYYRKDGDTGSGTKRAVSARHREGLHAGYPNMLVQPVDTLGKKYVMCVYNCMCVCVHVLLHGDCLVYTSFQGLVPLVLFGFDRSQ